MNAAQSNRSTIPPSIDSDEFYDADIPPPVSIIRGVLDAGAKGLIVGPSKARKSFFALQAALSLATGRDFLGMLIPAPRRVLLWQSEVPDGHFKTRHDRMRGAMGIEPGDLAGRLRIVNARGFAYDPRHHRGAIAKAVTDMRADVVILDPLYRFLTGNESDPLTIAGFIGLLDAIADTGAAVLTVHHAPKGVSGDRQTIDRASGSGYLARDFDCQLSITPHRDETDQAALVVLETICRAHPPRRPETLEFSDGLFTVSGLAPVVKTTHNARRGGGATTAPTSDAALAAVAAAGVGTHAAVCERIRRAGFTRDAARAALDELLASGRIVKWRVPGFGTPTYYGTPGAIQVKRHEHENPELAGVAAS